jgi:Protein of unknown function (DUF541)
MRIAITATTVATIGVIASGGISAASAETLPPPAVPPPTTPPVRSVSVQGVAIEPIDQSAVAAAATAVYRQGMTDAVSDGLAKAQFLAGKTGATVGPVLSIVEGGGYIGCTGNNEYLGEQPDFGSAPVSLPANGVSARGAPTRSTPAVHTPAVKRHKHRRAPKAKRTAAATTCTLSAQVSLVYALS